LLSLSHRAIRRMLLASLTMLSSSTLMTMTRTVHEYGSFHASVHACFHQFHFISFVCSLVPQSMMVYVSSFQYSIPSRLLLTRKNRLGLLQFVTNRRLPIASHQTVQIQCRLGILIGIMRTTILLNMTLQSGLCQIFQFAWPQDAVRSFLHELVVLAGVTNLMPRMLDLQYLHVVLQGMSDEDFVVEQ